MVVNPAGLVQIGDGGAPRVVHGVARETISGGQFVYASGAAAAVSSGLNSFVTNDIKFNTGASGAYFTGIALGTTTSGTNALISVATRGLFIVTAAATVIAGEKVGCNGGDAFVPANAGSFGVGRAITAAGSEGYFILDLQG